MVMPYKNADDHIAIDKGTFVDAYDNLAIVQKWISMDMIRKLQFRR